MRNKSRVLVVALFAWACSVVSVHGASPVGTAFTYQGQLKQGGTPVNGDFDFRFTLMSTGVPVGLPFCVQQLAVANGLFTVDLDFGLAVLDGSALDLQIEVKTFEPGGFVDCNSHTLPNPFTTLTPIQPITATPYAVRALSAPNGHALDASDGSPRNALVVDAEGDVGIGTAPASAENFHVKGDARFDGTNGLSVRNPNNNSAVVRLSWLNDIARIRWGGSGVGAANGFDFEKPGEVSLLRILDNGNIGIGTATPANKLEVVAASNGDGIRVTGSAIPSTKSPGMHLYDDATQRGTLGLAEASNAFSSDAEPGDIVLRTNTGKLLLQNGSGVSAIAVSGNNVGIGTATPVNGLHINANVDIGAGMTGGSVRIGSPTSANMLLDANEIQAVSNGTSANLGLNVKGGSVGIGTASPGAALHIAGDVRADGGVGYHARNPNNVGAQLILGWLDDQARIRVGGGDPGGSNGLDIQTFGDRSLLRLLNNGNIGIGTTTPARTIDVLGAQPFLRMTATNDEVGPVLDFKTTDTDPLDIANIRFLDSTDAIAGRIEFTHVTAFRDPQLRFEIGGTTKMTIEDSEVSVKGILRITDAGVSELTGPLQVQRAANGDLVWFLSGGFVQGDILLSNGTVSYNAFTGSHYAWSRASLEEGMLVSMTGVNRAAGPDGQGEPVYGVALTSQANDRAVLGAYAGPHPINGQTDTHLIASVGNGDMWVTEASGDIEPGDYLISSDVPGHVMRDDASRFPIGHVVARAAQRVKWSEMDFRTDKGQKHVKISVLFDSFVRNSEAVQLAVEVQRLRAALDQQKNEIDSLRAKMELGAH